MISAIILAAGLSTRMGKQKMLLPWGETTVIGKVISTLLDAGIHKPCVVTGGNREELASKLSEVDVQFVVNNNFTNGEMITSLQVGLRTLGAEVDATLVVLGDQPQIEVSIVKKIVARYETTNNPIIVPSYKMHRGHPWVIGKTYWEEIQLLQPPATLRDFLNRHDEIIDYIIVDSPSVLLDLDTQNDYSQYKP